ncbi:conserved hypothetical protein [Vibrio chagasii]|nr:conserved hypothetical protein [Vibrio chagasii]
MKKSVAVYTEEHPVADHRVNEWFEQVKEQEVINFSNNTQYLKLRLEHMKGTIVIDHFDMKGEECRIKEDGEIDYFPEDFLDVSFNLALEISKLNRKLKQSS